ncbi:gastric triacylglycerol lipase-like [Penaeus japonicus]|uniref:gastric triacylglycerol lipase-like n=1 Tax=Penaeus japonicus TaxID=27405 RepID=UPI001C712C67|nr:gastric triacylglycerol lipase-like [Penaeus japonicus]XP_042860067.1 gastric triacylglycerol lipase-like [Penaeus japonicus]
MGEMTLSQVLVTLALLTAAFGVGGSLAFPWREPKQTSFFSGIVNALMRSSTDFQSIASTADLCRLAGYMVEEHHVETEDGYILTLHHIPPYANPMRSSSPESDNSPPETPKRDEGSARSAENGGKETAKEGGHAHAFPGAGNVVFLQHGLMGSSDNWNTNTEEDSLAYLLSNAGYDVWMGNFRGNIYSRGHASMTHNDPDFWRFSYDEMARYDLPSMLDYVANQTSAEKLHYIGHSMGTTVFFALMSSRPEYQSRIRSMVALAPVATVRSITSPIKYLAPIVSELHFMLRLFGNDEELMTNRLLTSLWDPYRVCSNQAICENLQFMITGFDPDRADQKMVPVILSHNPAGASTQTLFHFVQGFNSGRFQQYDWGKKGNMLKYGTEQPPEYDVSKIDLPVTLFWAGNDWLTGKEDISRLEKQLPQLQASYKVSNPVFSHLDFLWANDVHSLVYDKLFEVLNNEVRT